MARSLAQIKNQMERLQSEAIAIQEKERAEVIERIQTAINHYALTADELLAAKRPRRGRLREPVALKATNHPNSGGRSEGKGEVPAKYRDQSGNSWTGRGRRPKWLVAALAEGKLLDEFAL